jgi:hypothetical protein
VEKKAYPEQIFLPTITGRSGEIWPDGSQYTLCAGSPLEGLTFKPE